MVGEKSRKNDKTERIIYKKTTTTTWLYVRRKVKKKMINQKRGKKDVILWLEKRGERMIKENVLFKRKQQQRGFMFGEKRENE